MVNQLGIGPAGELLVQYKLLKHDIDSSRMTVDDGIDLVMYLSPTRESATIQVKTNVKPKPAGGKGPRSLGWYFPDACPAQWLAFCDLSTDSAWLFTIDEARKLAQQHSAKENRQLYWYVDDLAPKGARTQREMEPYRLELVAERLAGQWSERPANSSS